MKNIFRIPVLAALLVGVAAEAQQYSAVAMGRLTNTITAAAAETTLIGTTNTATRNESVGLQCSFTATAASTAAITIQIQPSADGIKFNTADAGAFSWTIPANGTTEVVACTNLSEAHLGNLGYWKIAYITNAHASVNVTNFVIKVAKKPERFGP